jgi:hypothetical protein
MSFNRYLTGAAALALLAAAPGVYAQQTTASVRGVVTDAKGAPVAKAVVSIVEVATGTKASGTTDAQGNFDIAGLKAGGPYTLTVKASGYSDTKIEDINLGIGDSQRVAVALESSSGTVTVVGQRATRTLSTAGSRTKFGRDQVDAVVTDKRDLRAVAARDPLVSLDPVQRGTGPTGGLYIAGSAPRANRITIDGVRSHDDFGLNTGGLSTNRGPISLDAVCQMSVQAAPSDVEEGDFTGGAVNMVLCGGTNEFHGSAFGFYKNAHTVATQVFNPVTQTFTKIHPYIPDKNLGFTLRGPIIKDRLFFAISYEDFISATKVQAGPIDQGFGTPLNGLGGTGSTASGNGGVNGRFLTTSDIATVLAPWGSYASSSKLNPGSIRTQTPERDKKDSVKLDWNIMDGQRASFTYRHAESLTWKSQPTTAAGLSLDTNWYQQPENEDNYAIQLNSKWNNQFSTEFRMAYRNYQRGQEPPEGQGFANVSICTDAVSPTVGNNLQNCTAGTATGKPTLNFGPDQFRQANVLKTTDVAGHLVGTYRLGSHVMKAGYELKQMHIYNKFVQGANGVYYFDSIADFNAGKVDQLFYGNHPSGNAELAAAKFNYNMHTLFAQDSFDPISNLTVNYGLRYDFWTMHNLPALNPYYQARYGYTNQGTYDGLKVLQPRVGAKWHDEDGKFELSGSFGLYSGGLPDVFLGNRFGNTGVLTYTLTLQRLAAGGFTETGSGLTFLATDPAITALMDNQKLNSSFAVGVPAGVNSLIANNLFLARTATTNSLAPDFEMPSDWKFNYSGRWHAPWGTTFGIDGVYTRTNVGLAFKDLRARKLTVNGVQQYTPDGRERYDGLVIASTANLTGLTGYARALAQNTSIYNARVALGLDVAKLADGTPDYDLANPGGSNDFVAYNDDNKSWSHTIALSAQQDFDVSFLTKSDTLGLWAAYTNQVTNQYGYLSEFGTTESGLAADNLSGPDFNGNTSGKAPFEIRNAVKVSVDYQTKALWGQKTSISLFGDFHTGRPLSFQATDAGTGRSTVFGTTTGNQLAFIPQLGTPDAANPLKYVTDGVPVYFATAADVTNLKNIVNFFHLDPGITKKGMRNNPSVKRWDFHLAQELPSYFEGHKLTLTADIFNIGNLINREWGRVAEYAGGRAGSPIYRVTCADANGVASAATSTVCASYRISSVSTTATIPTVDSVGSSYVVKFGLKYSF